MASSFASCIMWIVCSQLAITSTHHYPKCNSTTLLQNANYFDDCMCTALTIRTQTKCSGDTFPHLTQTQIQKCPTPRGKQALNTASSSPIFSEICHNPPFTPFSSTLTRSVYRNSSVKENHVNTRVTSAKSPLFVRCHSWSNHDLNMLNFSEFIYLLITAACLAVLCESEIKIPSFSWISWVIISYMMFMNEASFHFVNTSMDWNAADSHCLSIGKSLVSIHNATEFAEVQAVAQTTNHEWVWIGLYDIKSYNIWTWSDGTPFGYGNDSSGGVAPWGIQSSPQPNGNGTEDCVTMYRSDSGLAYGWHDHNCTAEFPFICADNSVWILGNTSLPRGISNPAAGYYNDLVYLIGGKTDAYPGGPSGPLVSFSPSTHNFTDIGNGSYLGSNPWGYAQPYTQNIDTVWMIPHLASWFTTFTLSNLTLHTNYQALSFWVEQPCVTSNNSDYIFVIGGKTSQSKYARIQIFRISTTSWLNNPPNMTVGRTALGCSIVNNMLYAVGGWLGNPNPGSYSGVEKLDLQNLPTLPSTWSDIGSNLIQPRWGHQTVVFRGEIIVIGGRWRAWPREETAKVIEIINPTTDTIRTSGLLVSPSHFGAAIVINSFIFYFGGYPTSLPIWQFHDADATNPTKTPTDVPSSNPTIPTMFPTGPPTSFTANPTEVPSSDPTHPSLSPSYDPSSSPTFHPSRDPSTAPTDDPTTTPSLIPTPQPSLSPTYDPSTPTTQPSASPSVNPSISPSAYPSSSPTNQPSLSPTYVPSTPPTLHPTWAPSDNPSESPSETPSSNPSAYPSLSPTAPTDYPSWTPTSATVFPSVSPTQNPTNDPTTPYPTLVNRIKRHFVMVLTGNFDEFERYLNTTNVTKAVWAKGLVRMMINVAIYPQLANVIVNIKSVRKGSVIIDYSLEMDVISLLDLAEQNMNSVIQIEVHANLTLPISSNTIYTINPTTHPTAVPTTAAPSKSPTLKPTKTPLKPEETHNPTTTPTKQPTGSPTMIPTYSPTTSSPSMDPTVSPTLHPTKAPTPQDIECNHAGVATKTDGEYEYYLHIDEPSIVRFDTCHTLSLFDIFIVDTNDTDKTYSCIECGSICQKASQYEVTLSVGKYRMDIDGPHAFKMICITKPDTDAPTASPTTGEPTKSPTGYPSVNPTTSRPTEPEYPVFNVSFPGDGAPISRSTFLGDPYGRFEAYIKIVLYDAESVLGVTALCAECFTWQYRLQNGVWADIAHANDDDISVYNQQITSIEGLTTFQSKLTMQSIRRVNAGRCVDENENSRLFTPGNVYELRLQFVVDKDYFASAISNDLLIETNTLPSGGFCAIQDLVNLEPLKRYNLFCDGWDNADNLEYNALLKDVLMSKSTFVDDARKLQSVAPVGNVSIIVMIKEANVENAITCYPIHAAFKRIADTIHDKLNQNTSDNVNASTLSYVNDILADIASITNETSYSENPDVAVSIVTVIEDIYAENLTTQDEAAMIVDGIVGNILEGSGVLDVVISVQNNTKNISWVVLEGEDIISELATISSITSNEDIVDAETTTTVLVGTYLPQIFEAIDVFVDVNTDAYDNKTSNDSTARPQQSAIQDQLYTIAGQSQQLIENLESTLQEHETATEHVIDNLNNLAQSLVDYATLAASKALSQSDVGETFNYETTEYNEDGTVQNTKTIVATKFDANIIDFNDSDTADEDIILPKCGNEEQNIELPLSFMREQDGVFDCAFMTSSRNNFVSKQNRTQTSDTVSINIYNIGSIPNEYESNSCFPYLITMQMSDFNYSDDDMSLADDHVFPSCDFWNVSDSLWDTSGCFVYDISDATIICACTHLTTFSISKDNLVPEANFLTEIDWREFTFHNFIQYPTVWFTCLLTFVVFMVICCASPILCDKVKTKSIMAFEDIIYKSVQEEKLWRDIAGKEIKYITDYMPNQHLLGRGLKTVAPTKEAKRSVCRLQWKLYGAYLGNDHTLLSVFQRTAGTNLSLKQRLGCFFMYLCNIMVVTGTFYGLEQSTPSQDVVASFIISLCSTMPVKLIRHFFQKSKPIEVKSTKHILLDDDDDKVADLEDGAHTVPADSPASPTEGEDITRMTTVRAPKEWMQWDMKTWMTENDDVTISIFNEQVQKLYDQENQQHRIWAISDIRSVLFDTMFPLAHGFKRVGWVVLIIWSLAACITAIVYGFKFDLEATAVDNPDNPNNPNSALYQDDCWNNTLGLRVEDRLSNNAFQRDYIEQLAKNAASYAGGDAESWLLSIFQSLFTSLLLWQPLRIYVFTWIKIWMFSWHLKMNVGPKNIVLLCKRCCCGYDGDHPLDEDESNAKGQKSKMQMLSQYLSRSKQSKSVETRSSRKVRDVVAHKNRPIDLLSFFGNEEWIIDDTNNGNDHEVELHANAKQTASVKQIGEEVAHQSSDSMSLSNKTVEKIAQSVELQPITQVKSTSGSPQTPGAKSTNDEVKEEDGDGDIDHLVALASEYIETME